MNNAKDMSAEHLRNELPAGPIQKAVDVLEQIARTPQEWHIYQSRQKVIRDQQSFIPDLRAGFEAEMKPVLEAASREGQQRGEQIGQQRGEQIGLERGILMGQIHAICELLEVPVTPYSELADLTTSQLKELLQNLRAR